MKRFIPLPIVIALAIAAMSCSSGGGSEAAGTKTTQQPTGGGSVDKCPLDAAKVAAITGKSLPQDSAGTCRFSNGTATVEVVMALSHGPEIFAGLKSVDRDQYDAAEDCDRADRCFVLLATTGVEAAAEDGSRSAVVHIEGLGLDRASYKQLGLSVLDAIFGD
jgi:hypothetical protein